MKNIITPDVQDKIEDLTNILIGAAAISYGVCTITGFILDKSLEVDVIEEIEE